MGRRGPSKGVIAAGTAVAAGLGYVAGILTAPKSGRQTRKKLGKSANKAKRQTEKQLKNLHSELNELIKRGEGASNKARTKANAELKEAIAKAKIAKEKSRQVLSAIHDGGAEDPNLQKALEEVKLAKSNLAKFLKK